MCVCVCVWECECVRECVARVAPGGQQLLMPAASAYTPPSAPLPASASVTASTPPPAGNYQEL